MDYEKLTRELISQKELHPLAALGSEHADAFKALVADAKTDPAAQETLTILNILRQNTPHIESRRGVLSDTFGKVVAEGTKLQKHLPWLDMIAVGGTASALHAGHRISFDVDFITRNLSENFDAILEKVTEWSEWKTNRATAPVIILGEANDIELGIRQSFRSKPIATIEKEGLRIPTLGECFKIKAYLVGKRRATRDFVDTCALLDLIPERLATTFLDEMDNDFPPVDKLSNTSHLAENIRLGPKDLQKVDLKKFKGLIAPYNEWAYVDQRLRTMSLQLTKSRLERPTPKPIIDHDRA